MIHHQKRSLCTSGFESIAISCRNHVNITMKRIALVCFIFTLIEIKLVCSNIFDFLVNGEYFSTLFFEWFFDVDIKPTISRNSISPYLQTPPIMCQIKVIMWHLPNRIWYKPLIWRSFQTIVLKREKKPIANRENSMWRIHNIFLQTVHTSHWQNGEEYFKFTNSIIKFEFIVRSIFGELTHQLHNWIQSNRANCAESQPIFIEQQLQKVSVFAWQYDNRWWANEAHQCRLIACVFDRAGVDERLCVEAISTYRLPRCDLLGRCEELMNAAVGVHSYRRLLPANYADGLSKVCSCFS